MSKIIVLFIATHHHQKHLQLEYADVKNDGMKALVNPADMSTNEVFINLTIFHLKTKQRINAPQHYFTPHTVTCLTDRLSKQLQHETNL
jgi:hypothetical protein